MSCDNVITVQELETDKKHSTYYREVITGKVGGTGADIDFATNAVTGQTQATLPKVLSNVGFSPAGFDFTTGGTLTERDKAIFYQADGNWYSWCGTLPKVVPPASSPASTGGITDNAWNVSTSAFMYRDWEGFTAELLAQAGITDDGQPDEIGNSKRVYAISKICGREFKNVNEMIGYNGLIAGQRYSTGCTTWLYMGFITGSIADFKPLNEINARDFGAKGDGFTPDHVAIQAAIDCAEIHKAKSIYLPPSSKSYIVELPLVVKSSGIHGGDGMSGGTVILKTTNAKSGLPPLQAPEGVQFTAIMDVDSVIIGYNPSGYSSDLSFKNIRVKFDWENGVAKGQYGIYTPFTHSSEFINTSVEFAEKGYYGYMLWGSTFQRANTSACTFGHYIQHSGTSNVYINCYVQESSSIGFYFYGVVYSSMLSCSCDNSTGEAAYKLELCRGLSLNGCGAEFSTGSYLFNISGGRVVFNGFDTYSNTPTSSMLRITDGARVVMNACNIGDFHNSPQGAYNINLDGSHLITNETYLPKNGDAFIGYVGGATWVDTTSGVTKSSSAAGNYSTSSETQSAPIIGQILGFTAGGAINTGLGRAAVFPEVKIRSTSVDSAPSVYPVVTESNSDGTIKIRFYNDADYSSQNFGSHDIEWKCY